MLKSEGKINDELIEKLMAWHHSGFSVHAGNRIAADDRDGQKVLAEYIMRNAFSACGIYHAKRLLRTEDHL